MIALNDLARHHAPLRAELEAAMARVHARGWYILGPEVEAFEREFAAFVGAAECVAVGNGTDALELALRALDIGPGDDGRDGGERRHVRDDGDPRGGALDLRTWRSMPRRC